MTAPVTRLDPTIEIPASFLVTGSSGAGKTDLVLRIIAHRLSIFRKPFEEIIYFYDTYQDKFDQYATTVKFVNSLIDVKFTGRSTLIIIDDQALNISTEIVSLFTTGRHKNVTPMLLVQNIFLPSPLMRTIVANCSHFLFLKSPKSRFQLANLLRQIYSKDQSKHVLAAYDDATRQKYTFLWLDLSPNADERLRIKSRLYTASDDVTSLQKVYLMPITYNEFS